MKPNTDEFEKAETLLRRAGIALNVVERCLDSCGWCEARAELPAAA